MKWGIWQQFQLIGMNLFTFNLFFLPTPCSSIPFIKIYVSMIELAKGVWKSLKIREKMLFQVQFMFLILFAGQFHRFAGTAAGMLEQLCNRLRGKERKLLKLALLAKEVIFLSQAAHFHVKKLNVLFGKIYFSIQSC